MSTTWAPPSHAAAALLPVSPPTVVIAPWPAPDPAARVVDVSVKAVCPWPAPLAVTSPAHAVDPEHNTRRPIMRPLVIALGTAMVAIAAFGALFITI